MRRAQQGHLTVPDADVKFEGPATLLNWLERLPNGASAFWSRITADYRLREAMAESCRTLVDAAYSKRDAKALAQVHHLLGAIYDLDFQSPSLEEVETETQPVLRDLAAILEQGMLSYELSLVDTRQLVDHPRRGDDYVDWLKRLISSHSASVHPLYGEYIAHRADVSDLAFFMIQEASLDPRFDDILALLQIGMPVLHKLELAGNYHDELGNGLLEDVHSVMFSRVLAALGVDTESIRTHMLTEARAVGNLSACMALVRRHRHKAIGYFGVTEYLAPRRFKHVVAAWRRNALPVDGIRYHQAHIGIDAQHAQGWMQNVIAPMVEARPDEGFHIALGAVIRLNSSQRTLDAILEHFTS